MLWFMLLWARGKSWITLSTDATRLFQVNYSAYLCVTLELESGADKSQCFWWALQ